VFPQQQSFLHDTDLYSPESMSLAFPPLPAALEYPYSFPINDTTYSVLPSATTPFSNAQEGQPVSDKHNSNSAPSCTTDMMCRLSSDMTPFQNVSASLHFRYLDNAYIDSDYQDQHIFWPTE